MKTLIILLLLATALSGQTFEEKLKEKMKENRAKFKALYREIVVKVNHGKYEFYKFNADFLKRKKGL